MVWFVDIIFQVLCWSINWKANTFFSSAKQHLQFSDINKMWVWWFSMTSWYVRWRHMMLYDVMILSLGVSTVETSLDRDWDFLISRDQLLIPVKIFLTVERLTFFLSWSRFFKLRLLNRDLAASRFLSRLPRLLRLILTCILLSRQNQEISILIEILWSLRSIFWKCWDFLDCRGLLFASVEIESLNRESRLRHDRDKLRPPCLLDMLYVVIGCWGKSNWRQVTDSDVTNV
jgi:hypothetical protein